MSDGVSVYECTNDNEVIDLLRGGPGMVAIALGGVWRDVQGSLAELPSERLNPVATTELDEFTARRIAKHAS